MQETEMYQRSRLLSGCLIVVLGFHVAPYAQAEADFSWDPRTPQLKVDTLSPAQAGTNQLRGGDGIPVSEALWAIMFEDGVQFLAEPRQTFTVGEVGAHGWVIQRQKGDLSIQFKF